MAKSGRAILHVRKILRERLRDAGGPEDSIDSGKLKALAHALGRSASTVYNWRSGKRGMDFDDVVALAREFRMTTDQLMGVQPPPAVNLADVDRAVVKVGASVRGLVGDLRALRETIRAREREGDRPERRDPSQTR